jgi:cell division protein FtsB
LPGLVFWSKIKIMPKLRFLDKRILWVLVLAVLIVLMMDFNNRVSELLRLNAQKDVVSTSVYGLERTEAMLKTQIAYATSGVAVEQWAREEGGLSRQGDFPIVPISPGGSTQVAPTLAAPTPKPVSNWEVWQILFFGP